MKSKLASEVEIDEDTDVSTADDVTSKVFCEAEEVTEVWTAEDLVVTKALPEMDVGLGVKSLEGVDITDDSRVEAEAL